MTAIYWSSLAFALGMVLAFLLAPRAGSETVLAAGIAAIALGFAGLLAVLIRGLTTPELPRRQDAQSPRDRRPRSY